jgi:hypothetical protein
VQNVTAPPYGNCVPGIVSALKASNTIVPIGKNVDDFAFSFITPLKTDNNDIFLHDVGPWESTKVYPHSSSISSRSFGTSG